MSKPPVLILAYSRPDKVKALIDSLRLSKPKVVLFAVDGPRASIPGDLEKVEAVKSLATLIDWRATVLTRFRESNLGLKAAVIDAVNWAISEFGEVIVIEEDVVVGPQFIDFMSQKLDSYRNENRIGHVSGYNLVPTRYLPSSSDRLTRYPESIAWGTWARAWENFDEQLTWGTSCSIEELQEIVGSRLGALKWRLNFYDAASDRVSTWAYRWIASMWSKNQFTLSPNVNLVKYTGFESGSHTKFSAPWDEIEIENYPMENPVSQQILGVTKSAETWVSNKIFQENIVGLTKGILQTSYLRILPEKY